MENLSKEAIFKQLRAIITEPPNNRNDYIHWNTAKKHSKYRYSLKYNQTDENFQTIK